MSRLLNATEVIGLPVVTLGGDDVAEVRDVVYEPSRGGLIGFTLNKRGFFSGRQKQVLTIDSVRSVGRDAVVVDDGEALTDKGDGKGSIGAASSDRDVIGASVITDQGVELGTVSDVVISLGRKVEAVGYEIVGSDDDARRFFIPLPDQLAVSGDALMVPSACEAFIRDDLTGFGGAVDAYRADHGSGHPGRGNAKRTSGAHGGADSSRSKSDLYAEARELDISGRSSMTKAELVSALSDRRGVR